MKIIGEFVGKYMALIILAEFGTCDFACGHGFPGSVPRDGAGSDLLGVA